MPTKKKRVLVDMDGIVVDFFGPMFERYFRLTGEVVVIDQILGWDMSNYVGQGDVLMAIFREPGYFRKLLPNPGAVRALKRLSKSYDVIIASYACTADAAKEKIEWCAEWLPFIGPNNIFLCHRKELIEGHAIIDDGLHNAAAYKIAWPRALVLGISYPYNDDKGKVFDYRVADCHKIAGAWRDIVHLIEKHL